MKPVTAEIAPCPAPGATKASVALVEAMWMEQDAQKLPSPPPPPSRCVSAALGGDAEAFGRLIDRCERACLAIAYGVTRDAHLAADAVQEACLKGWHAREALREPERFESWLLSIVRRCATDLVRKRKPMRLLDAAAKEGAIDPPAGTATPVEAAAARERDETVRQVIGELDESSRIAVAMRFYDGRPSSDIAQALGCSPAAVDMRLKRVRERLATLLEARGLDEE